MSRRFSEAELSTLQDSTITIRTDANTSIGVGHFMRMLALAQAWQERGGKVVFASVDMSPQFLRRIDSEGFLFCELPIDSEIGSQEDAEKTMQAARSFGSSSLVIDGYSFDENYQQSVISIDRDIRVMAVDDFGMCESWYVDFVLNQNIYASIDTQR